MKKSIFILICSTVLFSSCSSMMQAEHESVRANRVLRTPAEMQAYINKTIDKKTLKRLENAVSDDTIIIEIFDARGNRL